jgi:TPR repeat protein
LARAQLNLGVMCENGWGLAQDYAEAMRWYRMAAEQDLPIAERAVGALYVNGLGVPQDLAEARKWLEKAAAGGDDVAAQWLREN